MFHVVKKMIAGNKSNSDLKRMYTEQGERLPRVLVRKNWSGEAGLPISTDYESLFITISGNKSMRYIFKSSNDLSYFQVHMTSFL